MELDSIFGGSKKTNRAAGGVKALSGNADRLIVAHKIIELSI
jgi:hypothetical protein